MAVVSVASVAIVRLSRRVALSSDVECLSWVSKRSNACFSRCKELINDADGLGLSGPSL